MTTLITADGPIEVAPGRGDLTRNSAPFVPGYGLSTSLALSGGQNISYADIFAAQPWVAAAVLKLLYWSVRVPLKTYRRSGDDSRERLSVGDHMIADAIAAPWTRGSSADLVMALLGSQLVHGNGHVEADNGARDTLVFRAHDWRYTAPITPERDWIAGWRIQGEGGQSDTIVPADQMVHAAWWSPLGPIGVSPLQQLGTTIRIEDSAQRYQRGLFDRGARPPSAVIVDKEFISLKPEVRDPMLANLREDLATIYAGVDNSGRPALLPPGLDWKQVGHSAVEAELIKQRMVAREEIGGVYQLPPGVLGVLDKGSDSLADQRMMAYVDGLAPPLILIELALNAQLIRNLLRIDDVYVEFDFAGILRGDRLKEIEALREAIASALLTPNEGRRILNEPTSKTEGMDDFYLPRNNLWPIHKPHPDGEVPTDPSGDA